MIATMCAAVLAIMAQAAAPTHLLVVSGISGDPTYGERFHEWAVTLTEAARDRLGVPAEQIIYLGERVERAPDLIRARSTKEGVTEAMTRIAERAGPGDAVVVVLIGHGSMTGDAPMFNLPGPDMSAAELAALLEAFPTQRLVVANLATASGAFLPVLSGPNRVIITATKTGFERNETVFGEFFVQAFRDDGADVDKDGRTSMLEAFDFARREVQRLYDSENRLLTEHAMLDDNGDGEGSAEPALDNADGSLARTTFLAGGSATPTVVDDPELAALLEAKREIETSIEALRRRKDGMTTAEYERQLEALLVDLALKNREIREKGGTQ